ncbi:MAG: glycosyltransferase family 39 protein [Ignavibacteriales bacterium]|nr:glycosyltransferase family 39 protein [Ignavibacteriales bacterium]
MKKKYLIVLLIIMFVGSFLRFYKLDFQSMWLDELVTMTVVDMPTVSDIIKITTDADIHPPGFYIILHYWIKTFGTNDIQLKMISVLAGILSILAIYFLAKEIYGFKEGLISASLLSLSWFPIYYSQEVRTYSLLLLFSILSTLFFWRLINKFYFDSKIKKLDIFYYILCIITTSFIHYFGLYLVGLQGVTLLSIAIVKKKYFKEFFIIYIPVIILYAIWLPSMLLQFKGGGGEHFSPPSLDKLFYFLKYIFNDNKLVLLIFFSISFLLILKMLYSLKWEIKKFFNEIEFKTKFLLVWFFIPLILIFIISHLIKPVFSYRNLIIIYAPILILFARLVTYTISKRWQRISLVAALSTFLLFNLIVSKKYYSEPVKEQFRETTEYIISENNNLIDVEILA